MLARSQRPTLVPKIRRLCPRFRGTSNPTWLLDSNVSLNHDSIVELSRRKPVGLTTAIAVLVRKIARNGRVSAICWTDSALFETDGETCLR